MAQAFSFKRGSCVLGVAQRGLSVSPTARPSRFRLRRGDLFARASLLRSRCCAFFYSAEVVLAITAEMSRWFLLCPFLDALSVHGPGYETPGYVVWC